MYYVSGVLEVFYRKDVESCKKTYTQILPDQNMERMVQDYLKQYVSNRPKLV